ncbi:beta-aspartyl-peptidase, partial [Bacillus cereus]
SSLFHEVRESVLVEGIPLETALDVITTNPAQLLKLSSKGCIQTGKDADIVLLEKETLDIHSVIAKGKFMVENKVPIVKGTFE